jgi:hypothetical protein
MSSLSFEYFPDLRAPPPLFLWLLNYFVVAIECNESQDCSGEGLKDERQCCADKKQKGRRSIFILNNLANWKKEQRRFSLQSAVQQTNKMRPCVLLLILKYYPA